MLKWILVAALTLPLMAQDASAAPRRVKADPNPYGCTYTPLDLFKYGCPPEPRWNGASPPVYVNGKYVGQDPDPRIRAMITREEVGGGNKY